MNLKAIPKQDANFLLEDFDNEILLYHPDNNKSFYLNPQAAVIWDLCDGEISVADIVDTLKEAFPDAADQIEADVIKCIETFVQNKALTLEE